MSDMIMEKLRVGCAGWSYKDWRGSFYPKSMKPDSFLKFYSKYFNVVEINSTFYNIPLDSTLKNWVQAVPDDFRFSVKLWRKITHGRTNKIDDVLDGNLSEFFTKIIPLEEKTSHFLLQLPPKFDYNDQNLKFLNYILNYVIQITDIRTVIEFRHNSWFNADVLAKVRQSRNIMIGTAYLQNIHPFYKPSQKSYYIRLIGDRSLRVFDRVQRKQQDIWSHLRENIQNLSKNIDISDIFVIFNNHFSGFSPSDSLKLKKEFKLSYKDFTRQKNLTDFLN